MRKSYKLKLLVPGCCQIISGRIQAVAALEVIGQRDIFQRDGDIAGGVRNQPRLGSRPNMLTVCSGPVAAAGCDRVAVQIDGRRGGGRVAVLHAGEKSESALPRAGGQHRIVLGGVGLLPLAFDRGRTRRSGS